MLCAAALLPAAVRPAVSADRSEPLERFYPRRGHLVSVADRGSLQQALDRHAALSGLAVLVRRGAVTVLVPGKPSPLAQLLVGKRMDVPGHSR